MIETTGMANPGPLASTFWLDDELESQMHLDGVITIVDSKNILRRISEKAKKSGKACNEATLQIAYADILMLNKMDLVPEEKEIAKVVKEIKEINNVANIYKTIKSEIDLDLILNVKAFHAKQVKEDALHTIDTHEHSNHTLDHDHDHNSSDDKSHVKHSNVTTITITSNKPVDLGTFNQWLGEIIWIEPEDEDEAGDEEQNDNIKPETDINNAISIEKNPTPQIFRMKGIVSVVNDDKKYILQAVNDLFECEPLQDDVEGIWGKDDKRITQIVIIGRYLDSLRLYDKSFTLK